MRNLNQAINLESGASVNPNNFWSQLDEKEHIVQFYKSDNELIDTLVQYVLNGLNNDEGVTLICTAAHISLLDKALDQRGFNLNNARSRDKYITLDAAEVLQQFMIDDWPVKALFRNTIIPIIERAGSGGKKIRAFGEMVMLLWNRGLHAATIQLENFWNELANEYDFNLFCAYANSGFDDSKERHLHHICKSHSKIIRGSDTDGELCISKV